MTTMTRDATAKTTEGRLPDFLIIGASKSGTTTLYDDLSQHPQLCLPVEKEPHSLASNDIFEKGHLRRYQNLFSKANANQLCGEASTSYTTRPEVDGVAERAKRVLGGNIKLIYIVRDPVKRALSHHCYNFHRGLSIEWNTNQYFSENNLLLDISRYAMQLDPWISTFGRESLHIIIFEEYIRHRQRELNSVCEFLGIAQDAINVDQTSVSNRTSEMVPLRGFWRHVRDSSIYLNLIRPMIPGRRRSKMAWMRQLVGKKKLPDPPPASKETKCYIADSVRDDALRFADMTGVDISGWKELHDQ